MDARVEGARRYRRMLHDAIERGDWGNLKSSERLILLWYKSLKSQITNLKARITRGRAGKGYTIYGPKIKLLKSPVLAVLTLNTVLSMARKEIRGVKMTALCLAVGRACAAEIHLRKHRVDELVLQGLLRREGESALPQREPSLRQAAS